MMKINLVSLSKKKDLCNSHFKKLHNHERKLKGNGNKNFIISIQIDSKAIDRRLLHLARIFTFALFREIF